MSKLPQPETAIIAADLFCGAGGSSTGLKLAAEELGLPLSLTAVNHWEIAIATHSANHSDAAHFCQSIDTIKPEEIIPGRRLHILMASPECTHHSKARGGKPRSDQKRADAWLLMRWIEKLYVENLLIENVPEFVDWGPLDEEGKPDKRHRGAYFKRFISALKVNYRVEWKVLNAADYGDATSRERFFLIARRPKSRKIVWPEPTHASRKRIEQARIQPALFPVAKRAPWRAAREIIDWSLPCASIYGRKKPLSENTLRRIYAGLFKYSLKLFLLNNKATTRRSRDLDEPTFTQCGGNHQYLVEPYLINLAHFGENEKPDSHNRRCYTPDEPLPVIAGKGMFGFIEPYLIKYFQGSDAASIDAPLPTITANYEHLGLVQPFIVPCNHGAGDVRSYDVGEPLPTITSVDAMALAQPFILPNEGFFRGNAPRSLDEPLPTVTSRGAGSLVEPFLVHFHGSHAGASDGDKRTSSIDNPLPVQDTSNRYALAQPYLVKFKNNCDCQSLDEPIGTLTTKDCYGLAIPEIGAVLDIRFRMLQPHELAAAMGFPKTYSFAGTRDQKVKQIGNAVAVNTAKVLVMAILQSGPYNARRRKVTGG